MGSVNETVSSNFWCGASTWYTLHESCHSGYLSTFNKICTRKAYVVKWGSQKTWGPKALPSECVFHKPTALLWASHFILLFCIFSPVKDASLMQLHVASLLSPELYGFYKKINVSNYIDVEFRDLKKNFQEKKCSTPSVGTNKVKILPWLVPSPFLVSWAQKSVLTPHPVSLLCYGGLCYIHNCQVILTNRYHCYYHFFLWLPSKDFETYII